MNEYQTTTGSVCDVVLKNLPDYQPQLDSRNTLMQKLEDFRAPYLEEKLLSTGDMASPEEYIKAFGEFKKYAFLSTISNEPLAMTSQKIDKVWHQFILFTKPYQQFCEDVLGKFMHHAPKTSYTPMAENSIAKFINMYENNFGEIPAIWDLKKSSDCTGCASCASACGGGCSG